MNSNPCSKVGRDTLGGRHSSPRVRAGDAASNFWEHMGLQEPNSPRPMNRLSPLVCTCAFMLALAAAGAQAQSSCSSDGQPQPVALLERFINADCESCWSDVGAPKAGRGELAMDWIVPGSRGEDAPLSAAATRDSLARLEALGRSVPAKADASRRQAQPLSRKLRVAHGLAFNDYVGASIELKPGGGGPMKAWLVLVETIPAGTEGTHVERNLVRNTFQPPWDTTKPLSRDERKRRFESRPMRIPDGAKAVRLRVVGWVEDAHGHIVAAAQSRCRPEG
jgi:hypothetical protein